MTADSALCPLYCAHPKYAAAVITTAAATPMKIFLFPPLVAGSAEPPYENIGAEDALLPGSLAAGSDVFAGASTALRNCVSATLGVCASRAGAGALAAPALE